MTRPSHIDIAFAPPVDAQIDAFLVEMGFGFNPGEMRRRMRREVLRLNARSDAQLALFGLTRREIPAHVFHGVEGGPVRRPASDD